MRRKQAVLILAMALLFTTAVRAQDQEKESTEKPPTVSLAVHVVFSEYEGDKKISSLPYTVPVTVHRGSRNSGQVRMGIRVPLTTSSGQDTKIQYMDIGTNIDCSAVVASSGGQFNLQLTVERNSIYSTGAEGKPVEWTANERLAIASQPIVRHYRASMELQMKDGQTVQRSMATDPLSGRVLKVDVTLNVVK